MFACSFVPLRHAKLIISSLTWRRFSYVVPSASSRTQLQTLPAARYATSLSSARGPNQRTCAPRSRSTVRDAFPSKTSKGPNCNFPPAGYRPRHCGRLVELFHFGLSSRKRDYHFHGMFPCWQSEGQISSRHDSDNRFLAVQTDRRITFQV
jgi:hypothetical protein